MRALRAENAALRRELAQLTLTDLAPLPVVDRATAGKINGLAASSVALVKVCSVLRSST